MKLAKIIFDYPALLALPVFTNFAVGADSFSTCARSKVATKEKHLLVSSSATAINTGLTVISEIIGIVILWATCPSDFDLSTFYWSIGAILSPVIFASVTSTFIFLALDRLRTCCPGSNNPIVGFCCSANCYEPRCEYIIVEQRQMETTVIQDS